MSAESGKAIERFDFTEEGMEHDFYGKYVRHEDYAKLEQQRAALVEALQIARPYVEWSDESRSPEDYPESAEILRKKQLMIDAALKAAGVDLP